MEIIYYHPFFNTEQWLTGIKKRLPHANIREWKEGDNSPADYALVWLPPYEVLNGRKGLKAIFALGAGVDAVLAAEKQHPGTLPAGIPLFRLEDAGMALQMEEYATAAVLRYFRRLDEYQQQEMKKHWARLPPFNREDFVIGVMGLGKLGSAVAKRMVSFGFKVKGWSRTQKDIAGVDCYDSEKLDQFLSGTQLIVNLLPNTPNTINILNIDLFNKLNKGAYLVNIARGVHLVEKDLLVALDSGQVNGATLDVFRQEPIANDHPFWDHPKVTVTPHMSAITYPDVGMDQISEKITAFDRGEKVSGQVDLLRGY